MKIMLDTNIILDVLLKRDPFYKDGAEIFRMAERGEISAFVTASSITDIFYIARKRIGGESAKDAIKKLLEIVDVVSVIKYDIKKALDLAFSDYEDALQAQCAKKIRANYIVTRNEKDFKISPVKTISPEKFLKLYR
jgi:predicted nucleic acid-binding protein